MKRRRLILVCFALFMLATGVGLLKYRKNVRLVNLLDWVLSSDDVTHVGRDLPYRPGKRGKLDVYAPRAASDHPRPVLVFFYGGGWEMGRRQDHAFVGRAFASRGYVVVVPDYRLVPEVRFPGFVEDAAAAVRWAHDNAARFGGDPGRIVLAGHSAGAYLAMMLALDRHFLADAGVVPGTVRAVTGLAGSYDFYPFKKDYQERAFGRWPDWRQTQPIRFARADAPPLLLVAGTADTVVDPENAKILMARERALGSHTTELRLYPGLDHADVLNALSRPYRSLDPVLADMDAFFRRSLARPAASTSDRFHR